MALRLRAGVLWELLTACLAVPPEAPPRLPWTGTGSRGAPEVRQVYDARERAALRILAAWCGLEWRKVASMERILLQAAPEGEVHLDAESVAAVEKGRSDKSSYKKWKRGALIGGAAVTAGVLLAVTGGLAAPAVGAGITAVGTFMGAGAAAGAASVGTTLATTPAVLGVSFGAAGAGLAGSKMVRRTGDVSEFTFVPIAVDPDDKKLSVGIMVSGLVDKNGDQVAAWGSEDGDMERYCLVWESKLLEGLSTAMFDALASSAARQLIKQGAMLTVLSALVVAVAWPAALLSSLSVIDGKWGMAIDRSDKCGVLLAHTLLEGAHGARPVTLMGYSLGARVIFSCLEEIAKAGPRGVGIVERAVLLGAPVPVDRKRWTAVRRVVAGRLINGFSKSDWTMGLVYRASLVSTALAGLTDVDAPGVENVDLSDLVQGHSSYMSNLPEILMGLDLDSCLPAYPARPMAKPKEGSSSSRRETEDIRHGEDEK